MSVSLIWLFAEGVGSNGYRILDFQRTMRWTVSKDGGHGGTRLLHSICGVLWFQVFFCVVFLECLLLALLSSSMAAQHIPFPFYFYYETKHRRMFSPTTRLNCFIDSQIRILTEDCLDRVIPLHVTLHIRLALLQAVSHSQASCMTCDMLSTLPREI